MKKISFANHSDFPMNPSYSITLETSSISAKGLYHLVFRVPSSLSKTFQKPGQYVNLEYQKERGTFSIANRVGCQERFEFLVKKSGILAEMLCGLKTGGSLLCSSVHGKGFGLERILKARDKRAPSYYPRELYLFSMGSGLSPIRSLLLSLFSDGIFFPNRERMSFDKIILWQGSMSQEYLPFREEYDDWKNQGVEIQLCLDQKSGPKEQRGNILNILQRRRPNLSATAACWAGSEEFGLSLEKCTRNLGLKPKYLFSNL